MMFTLFCHSERYSRLISLQQPTHPKFVRIHPVFFLVQVHIFMSLDCEFLNFSSFDLYVLCSLSFGGNKAP